MARHHPENADERANWWLHLLVQIKHDVWTQPYTRAEWAGLYLWAVAHGGGLGVFTPAETAGQVATFVACLRADDLAEGVEAVLPTTDALVEACLRQIPIPLDDIPNTSDLTRVDLNTLRRSRQARNLITLAAPHLAHVRDPRLADTLTAWIAVLPRLV